ncbi:MAG: aromatic ring-hydroxylating oxygenase subunit alpha, partial [Gammaproteobacteria bacterium]
FSTPHIGGQGEHTCEGFERSRHGLKPVSSSVWMDMVFVNLSGTAEPFEDYISPLAERWRHYDASGFVHGGADASWELALRCNWKLAVENHCDAYHLPWVHPGLNTYSRFEDHYEILERDSFSGQGSTNYAPRLPPACAPLPRVDVGEHWRQRAEYVSLFPNVMIGVCADHYWSVWLEPLACDHVIERMNLYYLGEAATSDVYASSREAMRKEWLNIWTEDRGIVELMQRGRASPAFQGGAFSPALDGATHELNRWVAQRLPGAAQAVDCAA